MALLDWATRMLSCLLREDATALAGDLREVYERHSSSAGAREAGRCYRREVYRSLGAALRLRVAGWVRAAPWGTAIGSYVMVGAAQLGSTMMLSRVWPAAAQTTSPLNLAVEFPVIALVAYVAGAFHRAAPFLLAAMMLLAAVLLIRFSSEEISTEFRLAFLTLGPLAAGLGGALHYTRRLI